MTGWFRGDSMARWRMVGALALAGASAVGAAIAVERVSAADENVRPFAAAVLRRDGVLIPIATFTGRIWDPTWPGAGVERIDIPITLSAVPREWWGKLGPRDEWQLWIDGAARGSVHVKGTTLVPAMCDRRVALTTDYSSADAPPPTVRPYPKAGLAVSPPTSIERIEVLTATSEEWRGIGPTLTPAFNEAEDRLAQQWTAAGDPHPIQRKERIATPVTTEAIYANGTGAARTLFVEAMRVYDHSADENPICATAFGAAFFQRDGGRFVPIAMTMRVVPCDRRGLMYMLPLGAVRAGGRLFWIAQFSGWDHEEYDIIEVKRLRIQVVAGSFGGDC